MDDHQVVDDGLEAEGRVLGGLFSPEGRLDPHVVYRSASLPGFDYAVVNEVLRDDRFLPPAVGGEQPFWNMFSRWLISLDGERHRAMRARFSSLFTASRVESFRAVVSAKTEELLDGVQDRDEMDLVTEFARPLPFSVIVSVLGIPPARWDWVEEQTVLIGQTFAYQRDPAFIRRADTVVEELGAMFADLLDERATHPKDDLLSALAADGTDDPEARADLIANCVFFIQAGHASTTSLIAAGTLLLLERPDRLERLRAHPEEMRPAVEEMLRMVTPITVVPRHAGVDMTVAGCPFPVGVDRFLFLPAANRDPKVFADPDRFDPARRPNRHLAFSAGDHFCVGAPLARLHGEVAISAMLRRLTNLRLAGEHEWRGSIPLRELEHLPLAWG